MKTTEDLKDLKVRLLVKQITKLDKKYNDYNTIAHNASIGYDDYKDELRILMVKKEELVTRMEEQNDLLIKFSKKRDKSFEKQNKKLRKLGKLTEV